LVACFSMLDENGQMIWSLPGWLLWQGWMNVREIR
jgi:hypothetical protein